MINKLRYVNNIASKSKLGFKIYTYNVMFENIDYLNLEFFLF